MYDDVHIIWAILGGFVCGVGITTWAAINIFRLTNSQAYHTGFADGAESGFDTYQVPKSISVRA